MAYLRSMKIIAALLIVVGLVGLVYGGFRVAYPDNIIDAGALQVTVTKHKSLPIPPIWRSCCTNEPRSFRRA